MANHYPGGNNRKSVAQHKLDGTFRNTRHKDVKNPTPPTGRPEVPEPLGERGAREWDRMLWRLESSGSLSTVDDVAIYEYCKLFEETEDVAEQRGQAQASLAVLEENLGDVDREDKVALFSQIVTLHKTISKCTDQLRSGRTALRLFLGEFGLTPASRGRIKLPQGQAETVDDFTAFQQQRVS